MGQVVPTMDPVWKSLEELYLFQNGVGNLETLTATCRVYVGTHDALREVLGYGLEDEDFEVQIWLVSDKYIFSN